MAYRRKDGDTQPGIRWWKFTTRIPGIHVDFSLPEIIQGGLLSTATGGVVAALTMKYFQVPFDVAWAIVLIQFFWVWALPTVICGEPYVPGWLTPALPIVMTFLGGFEPGLQAIQAMTAVTVCVSFIFIFFALTGLGDKFVRWVPTELRAAIIFGGAFAAFNAEFGRMEKMPITLPIVWAVVFLLMFSVWFTSARKKNKLLDIVGSMALLVGFLVAAVVGPLTGELAFDIEMGFRIPQIGEYIKAVSPFYVGWPAFEYYVKAFPLAIMVYIFVFGDLILGKTLLDQAAIARPDEKLEMDNTRSHIILFVRNMGHLLSAGPFIPLHGPLWTGIHVFLCERYKSGRKNLDSFFTGVFNWYWPAFFLIFLVPVITFMKPLLTVALSITLILTGFACAYSAISMVKTPAAQGYAFFVGMIIARFGPAWGLGAGVALYILLLAQGIPGFATDRKSS
jgi:hypothetical protein